MGEMAALALMAVGGATKAGGSVLSGIGDLETIKSNVKINRANAARQDEQLRTEGSRLLSSNVVGAAKSGVRLEGSPLEVMASNAAEIVRKRGVVRQQFGLARDLLQVQKKAATQGLVLNTFGELVSGSAGVASASASLGLA